MLSRLARFLNWCLSHVGYVIVRAPTRRRARTTGSVPAKMIVAGKTLLVNSESILREIYEENPNNNAMLARLGVRLQARFPSMSAVDIGANVGDTAAILRSAVGSLPIVCIEGDPVCFSLLAKNSSVIGNVELLQVFLSDKSGTESVRLSKQGWNATIHSEPKGTVGTKEVPFTTLDDLAAQNDLVTRCKLLKVDTEGFDLKILRGGVALLTKAKPVIIFEYSRETLNATDPESIGIFSWLLSLGYQRMLIWDAYNQFFTAINLDNSDFISDLHEFADGRPESIYYYDFCVFPAEHSDLARACEADERIARRRNSVATVRSGPV